MPEFTLEKIVAAILVIVAFIILAVFVLGLKTPSTFWYLGCTGEVGGKNHTILVDGKMQMVYDNNRCTIFSTNESCLVANYKPIVRDDENITVCLWSGASDKCPRGEVCCHLNGELSCEDFSQLTVPTCSDVIDCRPVSAIKMAVERLKQ
jgi:hypothetical protein